jgi:hypothetical protein
VAGSMTAPLEGPKIRVQSDLPLSREMLALAGGGKISPGKCHRKTLLWVESRYGVLAGVFACPSNSAAQARTSEKLSIP